jgi:hypothetical protein
MRGVSGIIVETMKTHVYSIPFLSVEWDRPQMTIWFMHIVCWITKATNTHSEYVILIAFPLESASMLGDTYIMCVVISCFLM